VEDALKSALDPSAAKPTPAAMSSGPSLADQITPSGKVKIHLLPKS